MPFAIEVGAANLNPGSTPNTPWRFPMSFALLKGPATEAQLLIRNDHVSAVELDKDDQSFIHLLGGQTLHLSYEQSRQFVHHVKAHLHPNS
jgi:hypothetical protein